MPVGALQQPTAGWRKTAALRIFAISGYQP
jgi:hypothetical protein